MGSDESAWIALQVFFVLTCVCVGCCLCVGIAHLLGILEPGDILLFSRFEKKKKRGKSLDHDQPVRTSYFGFKSNSTLRSDTAKHSDVEGAQTGRYVDYTPPDHEEDEFDEPPTPKKQKMRLRDNRGVNIASSKNQYYSQSNVASPRRSLQQDRRSRQEDPDVKYVWRDDWSKHRKRENDYSNQNGDKKRRSKQVDPIVDSGTSSNTSPRNRISPRDGNSPRDVERRSSRRERLGSERELQPERNSDRPSRQMSSPPLSLPQSSSRRRSRRTSNPPPPPPQSLGSEKPRSSRRGAARQHDVPRSSLQDRHDNAPRRSYRDSAYQDLTPSVQLQNTQYYAGSNPRLTGEFAE